jgi:tRNA dimethylallyltransferase
MTPKIVAIVGPTGSGKTAMALQLAKKFDGEIICADSRTIYKGMDIGTAKPTKQQQKIVIHHCLDIINPDQQYSVAQFKACAVNAINDISSRGKLPFLVGGSGLYIDAVLYDFELDKKVINKVDSRLGLEDLQELAQKLVLKPSTQTLQNKHHLVRFIERNGQKGSRKPTTATIIGIDVDKEILSERIEARVESMFDNGVVEETENLLKKWGPNALAFLTPGYQPIIKYLNQEISLEEAKKQFIQNDKKLVKKQITWFKNNKDIVWVKDALKAEQVIKANL